MKTNRWIALAAITLLVIVMVGGLAYNAYAQGPATDGAEVAESQDNNPALQSQAGITREEAEAIALAAYPGAEVLGTELEQEGGILLYSIELDNGAEVEVEADTGIVLPDKAETGVESGS